MKITYGIDVKESDDPYILVAEEAINGMHEASIPGAFLVDLFPMLKFVPSWFPVQVSKRRLRIGERLTKL